MTICQTKNVLTAQVPQNLIKQQIGIKFLQNSKVLSAIKRPTAAPNEESQQFCLGRSYMKFPWTRIWARSHLSLSKNQILLLWYQQTASWLPVPPFQMAKYSDCNTKGPMFWWSKVSPWDRPSRGSLGKHSTNKILQDLCIGELICFEFPIFCQHRIAQDGDKGE